MPRVIELDLTLTTPTTTGLAAAQTLGGAGDFSLNGSLISDGLFTSDTPRQLIQTAAANESARTFTITGTDENGQAQVLAMSGLNATTGETAEYWKTVTSIASDAATAGNVSFGTVDEVSTGLTPLGQYMAEPVTIAVIVTGTVNFTVQETFNDVVKDINFSNTITWFPVSALSAKTANTVAVITHRATGFRLLVNSHSASAILKVLVHQSRDR